jgi:hypothetical protein
MGMLSSRSAGAAAALALLATPVAGFLLLRPDRVLERSTPRATEPAPTSSVPSASRPVALSIDSSELAAARSSARSFAGQYVAYVNGRITAREIVDAAPELVRELRRHPPRITPAQQRNRATLRHLAVQPAAATVHAVATLQEAGGPAYRLAFCLERRDAHWLVTRLLDV